jgi:hypothetical protein
VLKQSLDFNYYDIKTLEELLLSNFNFAQVYAFRQWYIERYFNLEFKHLQKYFPRIYFFEVRKCDNGTLVVILATHLDGLDGKMEFHTLILFDKNGAYSRFCLSSSKKNESVRNCEIYENALDNSILIFSK